MDQQTYNAEVDARAAKILEGAHERGSNRSLWGAHGLMSHKPTDDEIV